MDVKMYAFGGLALHVLFLVAGLLLLVGCGSHPYYGCLPMKTKTGRDFLLCAPMEPDEDEVQTKSGERG